MFREVPVLPVVVPVAGAVFAVLVWRWHRRGLLTVPRAAVALIVCAYVAGVVANTVFPIFLDKPTGDGPWSRFLDVTPLVGYDVADAVTNIGVFVPIGFLVPLVAPRLSWWRVLAAATAFSLLIEVSQLVTANLLGGGHVADVNDLLFNVIGAALGLLSVTALSRLRWASAGGHARATPRPRVSSPRCRRRGRPGPRS